MCVSVKRGAKYILFCIGLAVAIGSSATSFFFLYSSMLGKPVLLYEPNITLAFFEMVLLTVAIGTCVAAAEVYHKYLKGIDHVS